MNDTISIGSQAETYAEKYLKNQGLCFIQRNFRSKMGEIDLIMSDQDCLVFIEVRYRKNNLFGGAIASIDYKKQRKLIKTAQYYLSYRPKYAKMACRFDVVGIEGVFSVQPPRVEWVKNAFGIG